MLFCALYTAIYWGVSATSVVECDSPDSLDIALCANSGITTLVLTIVNLVADFYVLALPIRTVMRLNVKRGKKIGLIAVFLCGLL